MLGAIVKNDIVENVIVINEEQVSEMESALECEIVDARPCGLIPGDLRTDRGWTRNAGGEQVVLEALEREKYDSYSAAMRRAAAAGEAAKQLAEAIATEAVTEAVSILKEEAEKESAATPMEVMSLSAARTVPVEAAQTALDSLIARLTAIPAAVIERWSKAEE